MKFKKVYFYEKKTLFVMLILTCGLTIQGLCDEDIDLLTGKNVKPNSDNKSDSGTERLGVCEKHVEKAWSSSFSIKFDQSSKTEIIEISAKKITCEENKKKSECSDDGQSWSGASTTCSEDIKNRKNCLIELAKLEQDKKIYVVIHRICFKGLNKSECDSFNKDKMTSSGKIAISREFNSNDPECN